MPNRRPLTAGEISWARLVFRNTLPYEIIYISDFLGLGDRPFTVADPHPPGDPLRSVLSIFFGPAAIPLTSLRRPPSYTINFGPSGYANAATFANLPILMHELTHVWQSHHDAWPLWYIFDSVWHQTFSGSGAYAYAPGMAWNAYNVEQQANIVEDWFRGGMHPGDPRFFYIQTQIRAR